MKTKIQVTIEPGEVRFVEMQNDVVEELPEGTFILESDGDFSVADDEGGMLVFSSYNGLCSEVWNRSDTQTLRHYPGSKVLGVGSKVTFEVVEVE